MAKLSKRRRPLRLEVGFEVRRGSRDALGRAYERLLPLRTRSLSPSPLTPISEGACDENSAPESRFGPADPAGRPLRPRLLRLDPRPRGFDGLGMAEKGQAFRGDQHLDASRHPGPVSYTHLRAHETDS